MKLGGDIRAADAAIWRAAEAGKRSGRVRTVAPVLAVEIAGEDEGEDALREKSGWYLRQGVRLIWLVLTNTREVLVIGSDGEKRLGRAERVAATELLPGLEPEVARFFAQLER